MSNINDDEKLFSQKFIDECDREVSKFLQEMEKKHGGLTYPVLFHYCNYIQMEMLNGYIELSNTKGNNIGSDE